MMGSLGNSTQGFHNIVKSLWSLGSHVSENVVVKKVLRSLPRRFDPKVSAIEESKGIETLSLDVILDSLETWEMKFNVELTPPPKNSIALKVSSASNEEEDDQMMKR